VVRASDLVARYGGEEFVVVAPDCGLAAAVKLAERFRAAIDQLTIVQHGVPIPVTTSLGVAASTDLTQMTPADLLKQADESLYSAKDSGRNATWFWDQPRGCAFPAERIKGDDP
jgi:diguanylate cyclase (GGDEF)-like protein